MILVVYVLLTAKIPAWAVTSLIVVVAVGIAPVRVRVRERAAPHGRRLDGLGAVRRLVAMARQGSA